VTIVKPQGNYGLAIADGPRHVPFSRLALCLDCDASFEIGEESCPACGSETWCPVARFLGEPGLGGVAGPRRGVQQIIVVSPARPRLYQRLQRAFAGNDSVAVVLDRRHGDRRRAAAARTPDRRTADRRRAQDDHDLRVLGWTVRRRE
jgi:hypothetical protein